MGNRLFYPEHDKFIRENVKGVSNQELTDLVNKHFGTNFSVTQVRNYKNRNHISSGLNGRFEHGHKPWNKGVAGYMGANKTSFKKGRKPHNWKPIGSERITKDGYVEVKVRDCCGNDNYELKHRVVWEKLNGKIPKGHIIAFKDGNKKNFDIDNLDCIPRTVNARMNKAGLYNDNYDFYEPAKLIAKIELLTKAKKELKH